MQGTYYAASDGGLNVRSGPSSEHDKLGMLKYGEKVSVTGKIDNNWYRIAYNGKDGYVSAQYLSDVPLESSTPSDSSNTESSEPEAETDSTEGFSDEVEFDADLDTDLETEGAELEGATSLISTPVMLVLLLAILIVLALICYSVYDLFHKDGNSKKQEEDDYSDEEYYEEEYDSSEEEYYEENDYSDDEDSHDNEYYENKDNTPRKNKQKK